MFPSAPPFRGIRLARVSDLPRIGYVAAAGFFHSPVFRYQRPKHNDWPQDTVASYRAQYRFSIQDSNSVVIVVEDTIESNEAEAAYKSLSNVYIEKQRGVRHESKKVIVGVASLTLQDGSKRIGLLQPESESIDESDQEDLGDEGRARDTSAVGEGRYVEYTSDAKDRILKGHMKVATIAVHPAYWRRGHASKMLDWMVSLADIDSQPLVVSAAKMGVALFEKYNFQVVTNITVPGYPLHTDDINLWMGRREPTSKTRRRDRLWDALCHFSIRQNLLPPLFCDAHRRKGRKALKGNSNQRGTKSTHRKPGGLDTTPHKTSRF